MSLLAMQGESKLKERLPRLRWTRYLARGRLLVPRLENWQGICKDFHFEFVLEGHQQSNNH